MSVTIRCGRPKLHSMGEAGRRIYRQRYQSDFEALYPGRIVAIEVESERAFVGDSIEEALEHGRDAYPGSLFYFMKIGARGVYTIR